MRTWPLRRACDGVRLVSPTKFGINEVRSIRSNDGADSTHDSILIRLIRLIESEVKRRGY
jgi:hypothetical protein